MCCNDYDRIELSFHNPQRNYEPSFQYLCCYIHIVYRIYAVVELKKAKKFHPPTKISLQLDRIHTTQRGMNPSAGFTMHQHQIEQNQVACRWGNYIIHEFLADWTDLLCQGGTKHHYLLLMGCHFKYFLNISTHIWRNKMLKSILLYYYITFNNTYRVVPASCHTHLI